METLKSLTSLRFFAAAAIFALHAEQIAGFPKGDFAGFTLNQGVSFFFVLSGFILHYNYRASIAKGDWIYFVVLRFFRLWPLHLFGLLLAAALAWTDIVSWYQVHLSIPKLLSIVFMLQAWTTDNNVYFAINGVSWSLSVEIFFYACFPALSYLLYRNPLMAVALASLPVVALLLLAHGMQAELSSGLYHINPLIRLPEFVVGILAAEFRARRQAVYVSQNYWTASEFISIGLLLLSNWVGPLFFGWIFETLGASAGMYLWGFASSIPCAVLIYVFSREGGAITASLKSRPLILLGEASFALYIIHQPIQKFMAERLRWMDQWELAVLCIMITILIAIFLHRLVEIPIYQACRETARKLRK